MPLQVTRPIVYAITSGSMTSKTTPEDLEYLHFMLLIEVAVYLEVPLYQIREKNLPVRMLYELVSRAAKITRGTSTRLLVNDRFDVARAAFSRDFVAAASGARDVWRRVCDRRFNTFTRKRVRGSRWRRGLHRVWSSV
jgi:hypothetical protein